MIIPHTFVDTFGLVFDTAYDTKYKGMLKVANLFDYGQQYTTQQVFNILAKQYRKARRNEHDWGKDASRAIDALEEHGLIQYVDGYYQRINYIL